MIFQIVPVGGAEQRFGKSLYKTGGGCLS